MMRYLFVVALIAATPATAATVADFPDKPAELSAKLANRCMTKGRTVTEATPSLVVCTKPVERSASAWLSFIGGTSMTEPPVEYNRYVILPNGEGSRVQASSELKAKRKNGTDWIMPDDKNDADASYRAMFQEIGGSPL